MSLTEMAKLTHLSFKKKDRKLCLKRGLAEAEVLMQPLYLSKSKKKSTEAEVYSKYTFKK